MVQIGARVEHRDADSGIAPRQLLRIAEVDELCRTRAKGRALEGYARQRRLDHVNRVRALNGRQAAYLLDQPWRQRRQGLKDEAIGAVEAVLDLVVIPRPPRRRVLPG